MSNVVAMGERSYSPAQIKLIKDMVVKGATDDQFNLFVEICRRTGLDPFRREIYGIIRQVYNKETKSKEPQLTVVVGIDGFRRRSDETGTYMPDDRPPRITYDEAKISPINPKGIVSCEVTLKKYHAASNMWMPVSATVLWDEFVPTKAVWENGKPTDKVEIGNPMWLQMPVNQLSKCCEASAHRKGWPAQHAGYYEPAEMDQAVAASEVLADEETARRERHAKAAGTITFQLEEGLPLENIETGKVHDRLSEWLGKQQSPEAVQRFAATNRESLRAFWAKEPDAALNIKAMMEERINPEKALSNG